MALPMIADPGNRLGESLSTVESQVEGLRHLRNWPTQGDQYIVYHNTEANTSYYFRNGVVIKEVFTYSGNENDATYMFQRFVNDFAGQNYSRATEGEDKVTWGSGVIPWQSYPKMIDKRYMKNGRSDTPCS